MSSKKVAIVGCSDSKTLAPFKDDSFEIWGVNNLYPMIPRANRWFEIHYISKKGDTYERRGDTNFRGQPVNEYLKQLGEWTAKHNCPVYMQQKWDIVPTSVQYPLQEIITKFGGYFTNTVSYEIALAILEGFQEIHVYGVDMAVDTEYHHQRPSCEYFLGIAQGLGIKVHIPNEADLLKTRFLYGFEEPLQTAWDKKIKMIRETINKKRQRVSMEIDQLDRQRKVKEAELNQYTGSEVATKELNKIWG